MTCTATHEAPLTIPADALVVGVFEGQKKVSGSAADLDRILKGALRRFLSDEDFKGKAGSVAVLQTHGAVAARRVVVVGLGQPSEVTTTTLRLVGGALARRANDFGASRVVVALADQLDRVAQRRMVKAAAAYEALAEGVLLASYQYVKHRSEATTNAQKKRLETCVFAAGTATRTKDAMVGIALGTRDANATMLARDLVNGPPSEVTPTHLVKAATEIVANGKRLSLEVFDEAECARRGMGAFTAVAKGSDEPSCFVHLTYRPKKRGAKKVFLVGKGVTFDSGGLHVKPWGHMENMKIDMAGAAAVLAVFSVIEDLAPNVEVHGLIPATENMPSGKAYKPGDVVRALNGKTIEINNTDAEGRVILADALSFAVAAKADVIIDLATLTGACLVALGEDIAGLFGNDERLTRDVKDAAEAAGEAVWELPLPRDYKPLIKSKVADIKNTGDRWGGAIMGGLFLQEFVGSTKWVHIDCAGPVETTRDTVPFLPHGATGFGVRTLLHYLRKAR